MALRLLRSVRPWRRRLVWGLLLAGGLAVLSVVFEDGNVGVRLAIILAIVGITVPIAVETRFRIEELATVLRSEFAAQADESRRRADGLAHAQQEFGATLRQYTAFTQAPASVRAFVAKVAGDWQRVEDHRSIFLGWLRLDHELDFQNRLRQLANGKAVLDQHSQHRFRTIPMDSFAEVRSLSATNPGYWRSPQGRRYLENQRHGIQGNGLAVVRTVVLNRDELESCADIIQEQLVSGVQLFIILRDEVTDRSDQRHLLKDFTIVVDKGGVTGVMRPGSAEDGESFTTDEGEVAEASRILTDLSPYERPVLELFPGLP